MTKATKVTRRTTAAAVTKSLSRRSDARSLRLTEGQRRTILERQGSKKSATA